MFTALTSREESEEPRLQPAPTRQPSRKSSEGCFEKGVIVLGGADAGPQGARLSEGAVQMAASPALLNWRDPSCELNPQFLCPSIAIPNSLPMSEAGLQALLVGL